MGALSEEILLEMKSTAAEIARLEARLARQVVSFARASSTKRGAAEELATALCLTKFKAQNLIGHAEGLVDRFPRVLSLVEEGRVPMASAVSVNDAAAWLDDDKTPAVDEVMAGRLVGKNPTSARRSANAAVARADPEGFKERARRQLDARAFRLQHNASGAASLFVKSVPAEKATAAYRCVDYQARLLKTPEETRTLEQLRADVATDMLLGKQFGGEVKAHGYLHLDALTYAGLRNRPPNWLGMVRSRRRSPATSPPPAKFSNSGAEDIGPRRGWMSWFGCATVSVVRGARGLPSSPTSTTATTRAEAGRTGARPGHPRSSDYAEPTTSYVTCPGGITKSAPTGR